MEGVGEKRLKSHERGGVQGGVARAVSGPRPGSNRINRIFLD